MKTKNCLLLSVMFTLALHAAASETTNSVNITTNLIFSLSDLKTVSPLSQFKSDELIYSALLGTSTNNTGYRHFPSFPSNGNFDFHLFDMNGNEVPKTKAGLNLTGMPQRPTEDDLISRRFYPYDVDDKGGEYRRLFRAEDVFMITNKGNYEMEIRMRLCLIMTNGTPDLKAMTEWRNVFFHYADRNNFGILTSPPLRVKVVKE